MNPVPGFDHHLPDAADELFEMLWRVDPAEQPHCRGPLSAAAPLQSPAAANDEGTFVGEDEMAAWLYPIVAGSAQRDDQQRAPAAAAAAAVESNEIPTSNITRARTELELKLTREQRSAAKNSECGSTEKRKDSTRSRTGIAGERNLAREGSECESSEKRKGRSRCKEVHNLIEQKRRDRINEKMKTLQQLIPTCNKRVPLEKVTILDETIEYVKSLQMQAQLQAQMLSTGYRVQPALFPAGVQPYVQAVGMHGAEVGHASVVVGQPILPLVGPVLSCPRPVIIPPSSFNPPPK